MVSNKQQKVNDGRCRDNLTGIGGTDSGVGGKREDMTTNKILVRSGRKKQTIVKIEKLCVEIKDLCSELIDKDSLYLWNQLIKIFCPVCGVAFSKHKRCDTCGIFVGRNHLTVFLKPYRKYLLCLSCIQQWKDLERLGGKPVQWSGLIKGMDELLMNELLQEKKEVK